VSGTRAEGAVRTDTGHLVHPVRKTRRRKRAEEEGQSLQVAGTGGHLGVTLASLNCRSGGAGCGVRGAASGRLECGAPKGDTRCGGALAVSTTPTHRLFPGENLRTLEAY
jgi:hypothetical protein